MDRLYDRIRGSLLLSAAGDALGYTVEFDSLEEIIRTYGKDGIQRYAKPYGREKAVFSDDTQMTLFTAYGLLMSLLSDAHTPAEFIYLAYQDWLITQNCEPPVRFEKCSLLTVDALHRRRAPGNTCLSALLSGKMGTMEEPINYSKGCGGVMRISPCAMVYSDRTRAARTAAEASAVTHTNPLGYIPSACMAFILNSLFYEGCTDLKETTERAVADTVEMFGRNSDTEYFENMMHDAVRRAENGLKDTVNIEEIGGGWVADEALAIAVYCALRHPDDPSALLRAAVNHSGDSDSTGAIAGSIIGARCGGNAIPQEWLDDLEMTDVLEAMAKDIYTGAVNPAGLRDIYRTGGEE